MAQEIFYQESGVESLQLMKGPVLFVAYPLQEAQDIAIMLWKWERPWKHLLTRSKVEFPDNGNTYIEEVPSVHSRILLKCTVSDLFSVLISLFKM